MSALRDHGPFETEHAASEASRAHERMQAEHRPGLLREVNAHVLAEAISTAGVPMGEADWRVLGWLAGWEPHVANTVAGMIHRAYQQGRRHTLK